MQLGQIFRGCHGTIGTPFGPATVIPSKCYNDNVFSYARTDQIGGIKHVLYQFWIPFRNNMIKINSDFYYVFLI